MDLKLSGRKVLITGGSKGIGLASALRFAQEGCRIGLVARTQADLVKAAAALKEAGAAEARTFAADLTREDERESVIAAYGDADVLVNNAGAIPGGTLEHIDEGTWRAAWDLKVFGFINMSRACFVRMKTRRSGVMINIIGAAGERLDAGYIAGSTGNAALMAFTRALGGSSPEYGIRVLGVNPGPVATDRLVKLLKVKALAQFGAEDRWQEFYRSMPFGRPAKPDEVAAMAAFLASDLCSYMTGTIVTIDGGISHRGSPG
jgi:3-oxoacyl-[acyl-carrier protein] reductase